VYSDNIPYYAQMMEKLDDMGIRILGGCCGTTPKYIKALNDRLKDRPLKRLRSVGTDNARTGVVQEENPLLAKLSAGEKVIMVELDPPFGDNGDKVIEGAAFLKGKGTDVITLSDSPLGRARMEAALLAVKVSRETGMAVMPHISCRDKNIIALRGLLLGLGFNEIRNLLIVTGDPVQKGDNVRQVFEYNSIRLMNYIKTMNEEVFAGHPFFYGGALNYRGVNKEAIAARMKSKMEAGASCFLTQPVYSREDIERIAYLEKETGAKIIVGIMPLVSHKNAVFIQNEMPGIHIPDEIMERYVPELSREEYEETAVEVSLDIIRELGDFAAGYYFMTPFNRYGLIQNIIDRLK
ncbi:MAG: methylenetetrahydrofolate reductase, partial [Alistipes sp.]|nr:methylenetetrahydrofolate reductase [Alistipes sp.]